MAARDTAFGDGDGPPWAGRVARRDRRSRATPSVADGHVSGVLPVEHAVNRVFFWGDLCPKTTDVPSAIDTHTTRLTTLDNGRPPPRCAQSRD